LIGINKESVERITIRGNAVDYKLVRSRKRKRSLSLKLCADGEIQLNVPHNTDVKIIEDFIVAKYAWIESKQKLRVNHNKLNPFKYKDGEIHQYLGEEYYLKIICSSQSKVKINQNCIIVYHQKKSSIKNVLNNWYRAQALEYLKQRSHLFANSYNLPKINKIKVRKMKARWGSCNSRRDITYNIHLIKASPESIDYVIVHELCHLIHQNHSPQFYRLQSQLNPNWKVQKARLDQQGNRIIGD